MISRFIKTTAILGATIALAGTATAGGNHHSTLPSLGSWTSHSGSHFTTSHSGVLSASEATAKYGSGSISDTFESFDTRYFAGSSGPDLAYGESLQATNCPVNVHGVSEGSEVVGCYNVVRQVPQTTYYRVVRPVIYVRYPVHYPVPVYTQSCGQVIQGPASRYGGFGFGNQGFANQGFGGFQNFANGPVCR